MKRSILTILVAITMVLPVMAQRPKVGLVLGGGGAKGAAEVGALRVIEEAGIPIDYVAGTSIGAIVGGLYAAGYQADELGGLFLTQEWTSLLTDRRDDLSTTVYKELDGITYIFGFPVFDKNSRQMGLLRGQKVQAVLDSMLTLKGHREFSSLPTPFKCVTSELRTASEVVLSDGLLAQAMRASMAIPGVFRSVMIDGRLLIDGGMMNNLPVDVVKQMGSDLVIAIDLQQEQREAPAADTTSPFNVIADMVGVGGLYGWITTRPDIRKYQANRKQADVYIHPPLPDYEASSFGKEKIGQMMAIGEKAAREQWGKLVELKEKLRQK